MSRPFEHVLTEELAEIVAAVQATGKAGDLTLKLSIKPTGDNQVEIEAKITGKAPKPDVGKAIFFVDKNHGLSRRDPNQTEMPFTPRAVEQGD